MRTAIMTDTNSSITIEEGNRDGIFLSDYWREDIYRGRESINGRTLPGNVGGSSSEDFAAISAGLDGYVAEHFESGV